jgi:hypothetical protein
MRRKCDTSSGRPSSPSSTVSVKFGFKRIFVLKPLERGDLFVPDMDPLDLSLTADGIGQSVQTVADDAINALDARGNKRIGPPSAPQMLQQINEHRLPAG